MDQDCFESPPSFSSDLPQHELHKDFMNPIMTQHILRDSFRGIFF